MTVQSENHKDQHKLEELKQLINDDSYIKSGIQHIAQVLSDEFLDICQSGVVHERK
jgi:hypothetical protein